jgi:hypothetical protein
MTTPDAVFRSGMAARLAGIPVATLRVWERRYGLGGSRQGDTGHRRYSAPDVARLAQLKRLVDAGHAIGEIARLPADALRALDPVSMPAEAAGDAQAVRTVLVGDALGATAGTRAGGLEVVATCVVAADAASELGGVQADLLAVTLPTLGEHSAPLVDSLGSLVGARGIVVAYRFGTDDRVETLRGRGYVVARAPLNLEQLAVLASGLPAHARAIDWPAARLHPQRYDEAALARLAAETASLACECPRHLVELLRGLGAFERYSAECAHRSPRDAELHRELQRVTSTARAMMEDALARVAAADGLG